MTGFLFLTNSPCRIVVILRIIITEGTQFDDEYRENSRHEVDASSSMSIGDLLEQAKGLPFQMLIAPYARHILDHLYFMHPESKERLETSKTVGEYGLEDGSILRLMSGVR